MNGPSIYLGIDAGGSKTELRAVTETGDVVAHLSGPAANPQRHGFTAAAQTLAELIRRAGRAAPEGRLMSVCAGVAGAGRDEDQRRLREEIRDAFGPEAPPVRVVSDAEIGLTAAFGSRSGIVVVAGTGSIVFARTRDGALHRSGGWGYLLGDEGSGHALGVHALRAVAAAFDGGPPTVLSEWISDRFGLSTPDDLVRAVYQEAWPPSSVAPLVVQAASTGDTEAARILREQTGALADQVSWLAGRTREIERRVGLMGGLTASPDYASVLTEALRERLPVWQIDRVVDPPVAGACRLALEMRVGG
jgi:glucosamine kinase